MACSVLLFGLWTFRSLETVIEVQRRRSCLVGGVVCLGNCQLVLEEGVADLLGTVAIATT